MPGGYGRAMPGSSPPTAPSDGPSLLAVRCRGCFRAAFLRQIGWDVRRLRALERRAGRPRRRHHRPSGTAGSAGGERRRHHGSRHRSAQAHRDRPRRAASPTSGRCGKSSPRGTACSGCCARPSIRRIIISAGISSASSRTAAACACNFPAAASSMPTFWSAATAFARPCAAQMAPEVQPIYAGYYIWRGAPNEADLAPETLKEHLSAVHVLPAAAPGGDHLSDRGLQQRSAARPPPLQLHLVSRRRRRKACAR